VSRAIPRLTGIVEQMAAKSRLVYRGLVLYYKELVRAEVELGRINSSDRVLCIGGGPCPISAVLMHEFTGALVCVIDNDNQSVMQAREFVQSLGYEHSIHIEYSDGREIAPQDYDVIHLAAQVSPLEQVLQHVREHSREETRILVRLPRERLEHLYEIGDRAAFNQYHAKTDHRWRNVDCTALFAPLGEYPGL
jgi:protein-L-isoaspartate O-methyltransferase